MTALSTRRLEWDVGEKVTCFVAHVVLGNSELLLSRSCLKAFGASIDLRNDQMHLEPEDHSETFHDSSGSLRDRSSEPDQGRGRSGLAR